MKTRAPELREQFVESLGNYLADQNEEHLNTAYEQGRRALQEGFSELDVIKVYHNALLELDRFNLPDDSADQFNHARAFLTEWLAPFEIRLQSYRELINDLNRKNKKLEEEINNRREVEEELQRSKQYFQSLIEHAQDIITVMDQNGIIRYSSPSIERILGYAPNELLGREAFQYVHPNDVDQVKRVFGELIENPGEIRSAEFRFRSKGGRWVYLESLGKNVLEEENGTATVVVNSRDVTDRKRAVQQLSESEAQLSEAQRIAKVGSWQWVPEEENGLNWSNEMCRIYGVEPEEFDRDIETFMHHVHPEDRERVRTAIEEALESRQSFSFEHRIHRGGDGALRYLLCRGQVLADGEGNVVKMIGTGQDITEQKERERKLREYSDRLRKLSARIERAREEERIKIAREVHDELGQMLTVLKMDISMLAGEMEENIDRNAKDYFQSETSDILERINVIIQSVQRITTELRPEVLDDLGLKDAIEWQAQEFGRRTGVDISMKAHVPHSERLNDEQATTLFRIFQETLTNVARHSGASKVDIRLGEEDDHIYMKVRDNGVGITREEKEASSSLGLIGMRERTQLMGGDVRIEGEKGEGTLVTLYIPFERNDNKETLGEMP